MIQQRLDTWVQDLSGNKLGIVKYFSYLYIRFILLKMKQFKEYTKMAKKYKVILISGGFDPVHKGLFIKVILSVSKMLRNWQMKFG